MLLFVRKADGNNERQVETRTPGTHWIGQRQREPSMHWIEQCRLRAICRLTLALLHPSGGSFSRSTSPLRPRPTGAMAATHPDGSMTVRSNEMAAHTLEQA